MAATDAKVAANNNPETAAEIVNIRSLRSSRSLEPSGCRLVIDYAALAGKLKIE